jgi:hypothetical protein
MRVLLLLALCGCLDNVPVGTGGDGGGPGGACVLGPTGCPTGCATLTGALVDQTAMCIHEDARVVIGCQPPSGSPAVRWCYQNKTQVRVRTTQQIEFGVDPSWHDCDGTVVQQVAAFPDCP